ncbi:hypothetical protein [Streptantibioticus ferralitis]|uniref:Uncharacterized protein n=1 Tax=Streptantibioticus ferralitis TaxID=236510 RepID=A0ABT5Z0F6_9ACTN|nr:hypothetical protein [Streptantibioticus ferralitis]MDF2257320.1 hypothetical protein [Streptantibioticus ferralitis]
MTALELRPARLPEADAVFRPTRRDIDPATGQPEARALWDCHDWQIGECWLWCGRARIDVTWIDPAQSSGMHADMYACRTCLYQLDQRVLLANLRRDRTILAHHPTEKQGQPWQR